MTVLSSNATRVYVRPARSIGGLVLDVTVSEQHEDTVETTAQPVEQGAEITDHAFVKQARVTIEAGHSDSGGSKSGDTRSVEAYQALLALQKSREPFDLVTGKRSYANMLIKSLTVVTDPKTEHVLSVKAEVEEVLFATVSVVAVPKSRQRHAAKTAGPVKSGQKQLKPDDKSGILILSGGTGYRRQ
ncbi:MAG: phage baseplate protein [Pseudodesulfovibrio sp.]|uniref:phage baseplate protein n=1 Tax=Pseudodesulfovibrio sp. TaxID=2035812 RepID=UPI003D0FA356